LETLTAVMQKIFNFARKQWTLHCLPWDRCNTFNMPCLISTCMYTQF